MSNDRPMSDYIHKAVSTLRELRDLDDLGIYKALLADGLRPPLAARLIEFVPLAYGRVLLTKTGARFSDSFQRKLPTGVLQERLLSSEPVWNAALEFARRESQRDISVQDFLVVAGRSAEFQAANELLNRGSELENLVFTPYRLPWPEDGPKV